VADLGFRQSGIFFAAGLDWPIPVEAACEFRFLAQQDFRAFEHKSRTKVTSLCPIAPDGQITLVSVIPGLMLSRALRIDVSRHDTFCSTLVS
jgi:hypothetical protein